MDVENATPPHSSRPDQSEAPAGELSASAPVDAPAPKTSWLAGRMSGVSRAFSQFKAWFLSRAGDGLERPTPRPPREVSSDSFVWGMIQPWLAFRLFWADTGGVRREGLFPVAALTAFCLLTAIGDLDEGIPKFILHFYTTFVWFAPVPPLLFANHYARYAVTARAALGFPPSTPRKRKLMATTLESLLQFLLMGLAIAPLRFAAERVPLVGLVISTVMAGLWMLHWVVVEALDAARVISPGEASNAGDKSEEDAPAPWFVRGLRHLCFAMPSRFPFRTARWILFRFASLLDRMSKAWRDELHYVERFPIVSLGFAAGTGVLMLIPIVNLFFRPIAILAACHVRARFEEAGPPTPSRPARADSVGAIAGGASGQA